MSNRPIFLTIVTLADEYNISWGELVVLRRRILNDMQKRLAESFNSSD